MIEGLRLSYADYKESGQEWLGRIPAHWDGAEPCIEVSKNRRSMLNLDEA